jgi:hypothetical protein
MAKAGMRLAGTQAASPKSRIPKDAVLWSGFSKGRKTLGLGGLAAHLSGVSLKGTALESPLARNIACDVYPRCSFRFSVSAVAKPWHLFRFDTGSQSARGRQWTPMEKGRKLALRANLRETQIPFSDILFVMGDRLRL